MDCLHCVVDSLAFGLVGRKQMKLVNWSDGRASLRYGTSQGKEANGVKHAMLLEYK